MNPLRLAVPNATVPTGIGPGEPSAPTNLFGEVT